MFNGQGGMFVRKGELLLDPKELSDFVDAREMVVPKRKRYQNSARSLLKGYDSWLTSKRMPVRLQLYAGIGTGGLRSGQLRPGTINFENFRRTIAAAVDVAKIYEKSLAVDFIYLNVGLNDLGKAAEEEICSNLGAIAHGYREVISELTGNSPAIIAEVPIFPGGDWARKLTDTGPSRAHMRMAEEDPNFLLATQAYWMKGSWGLADGVHKSPLGYLLMGEFFLRVRAVVEAAWEEDGRAGRDRRPAAEAWKGFRVSTLRTTIEGFDLQFHPENLVAPLVIDTEWLPAAPGFGFAAGDDAGPIAVVDVRTGNFPSVQVITARVPGAGAWLSYADVRQLHADRGRASVWGNLRDSCPQTSSWVTGLPLYNWCLTFRRRAQFP